MTSFAFTDRQMRILLGFAEGDTNQEIAVDVGLGVASLQSEVGHILKRLGAKNRAHAVALAYHRGILRPKLIG